MNLKKLLQYGYFPKELPPPFETISFAEKSRFIKAKWEKLLDQERLPKGGESNNDAKKRFRKNYVLKYGSSQLAIYSLAKGIYSRRKLGIPNPKQFLDLSNAVINNWTILRETFRLSTYSQSTPVESNAKRTVRTKSKSWNNFKFELIKKSFDRKVELMLDISRFYPSIYTHSIPWSILGKEKAKQYFKIKNTRPTRWTNILLTDTDAQKYKIADHLDTLVRNCNEQQSVGLPIGPDTSFIFAEIIGSRIDNEIEKRLNKISHSGVRYYDDYYFYLNSYDEAENTLKIVQQVLYEFQLETNESKVGIKDIPFNYTEKWATELSSFKFNKIDKYELRDFFSLLYRLLEENKKNTSWIVHYGLGRFEFGNVKIKHDNWDLFLNLLLQTLLIDPSNIDQIFTIIQSYKPYVTKKSKNKISNILQVLIKDHMSLSHSFEVSWSLWIFKSFKIKCPRDILSEILKGSDSFSILICLDLINSNLFVGRKPGLSELASSINSSLLFNENWLLTYESYKNNWLNFQDRKILDEHEFMKIMFDYNVSFYNPDNQIQTNFSIAHPHYTAPTIVIDKKEHLPKDQPYIPSFDNEHGRYGDGHKSRY